MPADKIAVSRVDLRPQILDGVSLLVDERQHRHRDGDYPTDDGGVAVIVPAPDCGLTIEEIAAKDVPAGKPFKIVDVSDIPEDRTFRDAWEWAA